MSHEIRRVLRAFAAQSWFIDARAAEQIYATLELRAAEGSRAEPFSLIGSERAPIEEQQDTIVILNLMGPILPRTTLLARLFGATSMESFMRAFDATANNPNVTAIVLNVDSPGGSVDLVPEVAAKIRAARRDDRPIVAVANTFAASAAYWIASAADELVVTPSGEVGSIGVYMLHQDVSAMLEAEGVNMTFISEGPRKVEGNSFEPLDDVAAAALQEKVAYYYELFVKDVASFRGVSATVVRADPERTDNHFGGGRTYPAKTAVRLGMADRVDTLDGVVNRLQGRGRRRRRRADMVRRRLALAT